ncbi:unnamed protein product, partial [Didymodactylos carnosus]
SDLFQYSIPSPSDSSSTSSSTPWILILFAGTTQNNKWAEMTRIPLDFLNFSSFIEQDITCRFGCDSLSTINLHLTPITTIKIFKTSIEDGRKTIIESENTVEQKLTAKSEDSFIKLKTEYQHLRPSDRKIKLVNWLMDLKNKCREIENISPQECTIPSEPNYKVICPQEISNDVPEIQMQIDKQALNVSSAPTHHFLMTQLTSEYEQLNRTILETINILNNNLDDNQLNRIQNGIVRRFDSADTLKKEMKIFQETFRFEKLATTLAKLHDTSIDVQKVLRSTSHFQQTLPRPIEHGSPVEFEEQLDKCRIIINETITLIHERNKQMSSVIQQQSRIINPHNIKKVVNVNSFLQSTYSPSTSKIIITKQNGEYFASLSSIVIRMEQIIQNWSYRQLRMKAIEIVNNSDDEIDFEFLSSSTERSLSVFIIDNSSNVVALHDSNSIKITPNVQANEGEYQEKWELKLANNRLSIPMKICCKIEPFSIVIDLPVMATTTDDRQSNQIKTYFVDFGVALAYQAHQQCKFTIKNPMSLDLCVKLRRKNGATGIFQIDNKHSNFLLFADESKEIAIDWIVQDIVQDSKCIYDIYFSKDFKYQILCLGKIRKISYDLLYKSHRLTGKQFREELQPCLPGTILYEELIIKNTGEVKMTMESKVENSSTAVVTILSHEQALLETNTSVTLKIDLQVNNAHRSIENLINLYFPHATQQPHFKLILNTTASWPELDRDLLNRFKEVEVEEKADEKQGQIVLLNKSPVEMLIDDLHSSSSHVIVDTLTSFPCTILPRQKTEFNFIYKVQTKLATFDSPIISFDQDILHCGTTTQGSKIEPFKILIKNDGHYRAQLEYEVKENPIFSFKINSNSASIAIAPLQSRSVTCIVEIQRKAPLGNFRIDVPLSICSSKKISKKYELIVTGRVEMKEKEKIEPIDLPLSWKHMSQSETYKRLMSLLEDNSNLHRQRAITAVALIIIQLNGLIHSDPRPVKIPDNLTCDMILSAIESNTQSLTIYTHTINENIKQTFDPFSGRTWSQLYNNIRTILNERLSSATIGIEGKTEAENLLLAMNCAEKLSILFEEHSQNPNEQILGRLLEFEKNMLKDKDNEKKMKKRLLSYASVLVMNQDEAQKLSNKEKQQVKLMMDKVSHTFKTLEETNNPVQAFRNLLTYMTNETNRNSIEFLDQILQLESDEKPVNEKIVVQKMYASNLPLNDTQLVTQAITASDATLTASSVFDFIQTQLDVTNESKNVVEFMKLSEKMSHDDYQPLANDLLTLPCVLASLSSDLNPAEQETLHGLQRLISHLELNEQATVIVIGQS